MGKNHIRSLRDFFVAIKERIKDYKVKANNEELNGAVKGLDDALRNSTAYKQKSNTNSNVRFSIVRVGIINAVAIKDDILASVEKPDWIPTVKWQLRSLVAVFLLLDN